MSEPSVGSVSVDVVPDARRFPAELARQVLPEAARIGAQFGDAFGRAAAERMARGVREGLNEGGNAGRQGGAAGNEYGGAFARTLKARLEAAFRSLPEVEINADSSPADREIAAIRAQLAELRDKKIGVDIDAASASAELERLSAHLRLLSQQSPDVEVRVNAGAASAELAGFQAEVNRLDGQSPTIRPDVDSAGASARLGLLGAQAGGASGRLLALAGAAIFLSTALIPVGAAAIGAMAAITTGAIAAAAGVGVLALALGPVIGAIQAVRAAHDQSAQAARGSTTSSLQVASAMDAVAAAHRGVASAVEDAKDAQLRSAEAVKQAERGVADAERKAAADRIEQARRVADARRDLADAVREAAADEVAANRRVLDADRQLADAQRSAADAQRDLSEARQEAAKDAQDLAAQVAGGALDERDAVLRVQEAQERLAEIQADPTASDLQRQRAALAVDQAVQGLADQREANSRLAQEKAVSDAAGIDGSKRVQDAQERLADAQRRAADAQRSVMDAAAAAAAQQRKSARDVSDAERDVADAVAESKDRQRVDTVAIADAHRKVASAVHDAGRQQEQSAEAVANAQRAVVAAQRGVQQASQSAGAAGGAVYETMQRKLAALAPEGRKFVEFINGELLPQFTGLSKAAQANFLPGFQRGLEALLPLMPGLTGFVGDMAKAMGGLAEEGAKALTGPFWTQYFNYVGKVGPGLLDTMGRSIGNLITGFAGLVQAFDPVTQQFFGGLDRLTQKFSEFGQNATQNSGFQGFISYVQSNGPKVVHTIGEIVGAFGHILSSLAPLGPVLLDVIAGFAGFVKSLPPGVIAGIVGGFGGLAVAITLVNAAMGLLALNPVILTIAAIVAVVAGLSAAFVVLYSKNEDFKRIVDQVWAVAGAVIKSTWEGIIKPALSAFWRFLTDTLIPAFVGFLDFVGKVATPLAQALSLIPGPAGVAGDALLSLKGVAADAAAQATITATSAGALGTSAEGAASKTDLLTKAQREAADASQELSGKVLTSRDAENSYERSIDDSRAALKANGETLDVHTEKGRLNREALDRIAESANSYTQKLADNGATHETVEKKMKSARDELIQAARQFGLSREEAVKYADKVLAIPDEASTKVSTPGAATAKTRIDDTTKAVKDLGAASDSTGSIFSSMWDTIRDAARLPVRFLVETIFNKGIIGTFNKLAGYFGVDKVAPVELPKNFATGGYISGPGGPRDDLIPAMLSNGEFVINAAATKRNLELIKAINGGADIGGDTSGVAQFAKGGLIEDTKKWLPSVDPLPYSWGSVGPGAFDCSGLAGEVWARVTEHARNTRYFTTSSNFESSGFAPGPGLFSIGVDPGHHMAGNLAGLGFEARSTASGIFVGPSAKNPSYFPQQFHLASLPGGDPPDGFSVLHPIRSVKAMFSKVADGVEAFDNNPFGHMITRIPGLLVEGVIDTIQDAVPGFAGGGLVTKYDDGGYLPPGLTTVLNATGRPEPVFTADQFRKMGDSGSKYPPVSVTVLNPVPETASESTTRVMRRLNLPGSN